MRELCLFQLFWEVLPNINRWRFISLLCYEVPFGPDGFPYSTFPSFFSLFYMFACFFCA